MLAGAGQLALDRALPQVGEELRPDAACLLQHQSWRACNADRLAGSGGREDASCRLHGLLSPRAKPERTCCCP